jgi:hypothetical protein
MAAGGALFHVLRRIAWGGKSVNAVCCKARSPAKRGEDLQRIAAHKFAKANLPQRKCGNFAERYVAAATPKDTLHVHLRTRFFAA